MRTSTRNVLAALAGSVMAVATVGAPAAVAAKPPAPTGSPTVTSVSASMSGVRIDPTGHPGCLLTITATVANVTTNGTLSFWAGLGDAGGVPVTLSQVASVPLVPGQSAYSATPQIWYESTSPVTLVSARIYNGRKLISSRDQKVYLICPAKRW